MKYILFLMMVFFGGSVASADVMTCTDHHGRFVRFSGNVLIFNGLDSAGLPSGKEFRITSSKYVILPGSLGTSYYEYKGVFEDKNTVVRLLNEPEIAKAKVWVGARANGRAILQAPCDRKL